MVKPNYLGLLNAIAVGEERGDVLLRTWADATEDDDVREVLTFVAAREREHAAAFALRIAELGYRVRPNEDPGYAKRLKKAGGKASDRKKFEKVLGYGRSGDAGTPFARFFDDETIDPQTGALLGRFIAEERDSGRRLRACYDVLCREDLEDGDDDEEVMLQELADRLDRLTTTLGDLKALRGSS